MSGLMARLPRIAIPVPTSIDQAYNRQSFGMYVDAITRSGGEAVPVPLDRSALETARGCDGVLLPGSLADVRPGRYGQPVDAACGPADAARETVDVTLLDDAERSGKPVLGICYGLQSMNVWRGGTLLQDLAVLPVNHAAGRAVAVAHAALVDRESRLGGLLDPAEATEDRGCLRLPVNSSHHQGVAAVGEGLRIVARSPQDGVVEALELADGSNSGRFFVAVQWHPERSFDLSSSSGALFRELVAAAARG